jgi:hypothetical protein
MEMSRKIRIGIVTLLALGALAVATTGTVLAQEEAPTTPAPLPRYGFGRGMGGQVGLEAIAEALGMTADELSTQLWGGKTIADLAEEAGVELADLQEAVKAALEQAQRDRIEQAVEDGNLTREHADWLLEGLDKGFWGGHSMGGFGGRGHGGFGGRGGMGGFRGFGMPGPFQNTLPSTEGTGL